MSVDLRPDGVCEDTISQCGRSYGVDIKALLFEIPFHIMVIGRVLYCGFQGVMRKVNLW